MKHAQKWKKIEFMPKLINNQLKHENSKKGEGMNFNQVYKNGSNR